MAIPGVAAVLNSDAAFYLQVSANQGTGLSTAQIVSGQRTVTDSVSLSTDAQAFLASQSDASTASTDRPGQVSSVTQTGFFESVTTGQTALEARLSNRDLQGGNFAGIDFSYADLSGSNLVGATLTKARLIGANLTDASLIGADLRGANLAGAVGLSNSAVIGARTDVNTVFPIGIRVFDPFG
ncbi:MAG: pentapeptide repeat-containing protein [Magnetovibrionaceae bacterium]